MYSNRNCCTERIRLARPSVVLLMGVMLGGAVSGAGYTCCTCRKAEVMVGAAVFIIKSGHLVGVSFYSLSMWLISAMLLLYLVGQKRGQGQLWD